MPRIGIQRGLYRWPQRLRAGERGGRIDYDDQGLLTSVRADNNYRAFPLVAVAQVRQIQRMIATGFSLEDIRSFPDCMLMIEGALSCPETSDTQRKRLAAIERQIVDLERRRARLLKTLAEGAVPQLE